ncbi:beta-glucosidase [Shewanella sp. Scap07]|nr:beta-glucosidase [Shewanella sp. Scap07]
MTKMTITLPEHSVMRSADFTYGVATAAFQIEGGANERINNIWDTFCAKQGTIADGSNGDIACDHFHLWQQDVELIASLGVDAYRFSVSWGRVLNQDGSVNQAGMNFYIQLLDKLNQLNIKPYVTLYHWDLPQHIEDNGGWQNRQTAYLFQDYAAKVAQAFGDRVHSYATLNEPFCSAYLGYEEGIHAPGIQSQQAGRAAAHHLLLAHGLAMLVLQQYAPDSLNGIVLNFTPAYSLTDSAADKAATQYAEDYHNQWYIKPLFDRCYPSIIDSLPDAVKPPIEAGDMDIIAQPLDFLGINFYTRAVYRADDKHIFEQVMDLDVPRTDIGWEIYPQAMTELLCSLNERYNLPPIYITENGASIDDEIEAGIVDDVRRVNYYHQHLNAVHQACEQGVNVQGYFAWSLMDNFEWAEGYLKRFGIVYVDYATQKRTIKSSGLAYKQLITQR